MSIRPADLRLFCFLLFFEVFKDFQNIILVFEGETIVEGQAQQAVTGMFCDRAVARLAAKAQAHLRKVQ